MPRVSRNVSGDPDVAMIFPEAGHERKIIIDQSCFDRWQKREKADQDSSVSHGDRAVIRV